MLRKDFTVDFSNAARLRDIIPPEAVYVAESGVARPGAAPAHVGAYVKSMAEAVAASN